MTRNEKKKFIRDLAKTTIKTALANVSRMPDEWDGHELRAYLAEKFADNVITVGRTGHYGKTYRARTKAYNNDVLTRNL